MSSFDRNEDARHHFLMPIPPTPNGRLHLGHIAGPYLKMDMLRRFLASQGHKVAFISAVDGFDTFVSAEALKTNRDRRDVISDNRKAILSDLAAMKIQVPGLLDLVMGEYAGLHAETARETIQALERDGKTVTITEDVLFAVDTNTFLVGAWLQGHCPECNEEAVGFFCENCGLIIRPEEMRNPASRIVSGPTETRKVDSLFLRVDRQRVMAFMEIVDVDPDTKAVVIRYLDRSNDLIRLTVPGDQGGVPFSPDKFGNQRTLFEAGWEYALTCGKVSVISGATTLDPFQLNSGIHTSVSFGVDNAVLLIVGAFTVMNEAGLKPFDQCLTNKFLNLQGAKFSTSRRHAIWASEIVELTPCSSDAIRLFLAVNSPDRDATNLDIYDLVAFNNTELVEGLQARVGVMLGQLLVARPQPFDESAKESLRVYCNGFAKAFEARQLDTKAVANLVLEWIRMSQSEIQCLGTALWLRGLALFTWPLMPDFSKGLWLAIGQQGEPNVCHVLDESAEPKFGMIEQWFLPISIESIQPCLPHTLA